MEEGVPPLEDVPEVLKKLQERTDRIVQETSEKLKEEQAQKVKDALTKQKSSEPSSSTFGGMKKGFLFGGGASKAAKTKEDIGSKSKISPSGESSKTADVPSKSPTEDIPFVKAKPEASNLVLKEVQEAMIDANHAHEFQEVLSKRLEGHEDVMDVLSDPNWIPILDEFQRDPEAAMIKYQNNKKVKTTLLKLCDVLGDTFLHMDKSKKSEEEILSGRLMDNPQVKEALTDPVVMKITKYMKEGANDKVHRCLHTATPEQKGHIQTLIDFGLLSFSM